jgi:uncharacterized protein (TIGR03067 family)
LPGAAACYSTPWWRHNRDSPTGAPAKDSQAKGSAAEKEAPTIQDERKQFEGSWQVVSVTIGGKMLSEPEIRDEIVYPMARAVAQNEGARFPDRLTWSLRETRGLVVVYDAQGRVKQQTGRGMVLREGTCTINPDTSPRRIDYTLSLSGFQRATTTKAIYEFVNKDTCRVCLSAPGADHPEEFFAKPGSGHQLWVLARVPQDGGAGKPGAKPAESPTGEKDRTKEVEGKTSIEKALKREREANAFLISENELGLCVRAMQTVARSPKAFTPDEREYWSVLTRFHIRILEDGLLPRLARGERLEAYEMQFDAQKLRRLVGRAKKLLAEVSQAEAPGKERPKEAKPNERP